MASNWFYYYVLGPIVFSLVLVIPICSRLFVSISDIIIGSIMAGSPLYHIRYFGAKIEPEWFKGEYLDKIDSAWYIISWSQIIIGLCSFFQHFGELLNVIIYVLDEVPVWAKLMYTLNCMQWSSIFTLYEIGLPFIKS